MARRSAHPAQEVFPTIDAGESAHARMSRKRGTTASRENLVTAVSSGRDDRRGELWGRMNDAGTEFGKGIWTLSPIFCVRRAKFPTHGWIASMILHADSLGVIVHNKRIRINPNGH